MEQINNDTINEIRNRTDIVSVISRYLPLTKKGKNYFGVCPFHDDHSPSMSVSPDKQIYTCFSCGATGNVFTFVADYEHISFIEAVKLLGSKLGYSLNLSDKIETKNPNYEICELASKFFQNNLYTSLGKNAMDYLENDRKFSKDIIKKFELGLAIPKLSVTEFLQKKNIPLDKLINLGITNNYSKDVFLNRIMFPLQDLRGNVVGFSGRIYNTKDNSKYVNTKETEIFKKNSLLYNYHRAREYLKKNESIIIMEGFFDVIRASTIGVDNCVATMGTAFTKNHALLLKKVTDNIILCFDGDQAGEEATTSAIKVLEEIGVTPKIIRLEEKDPDEYILKRGKDAFINKIEKAISVVEFKMQLLKSNRNLNDINEISQYIDESIKELSKSSDTILIELTLKKLSQEYNITYDNLKLKYDKYKEQTNKITSNNQETKLIKIEKPLKQAKYDLASKNLLFYMLKNSDIITKVEEKVAYFPDEKVRMLSNEIIYYYHKYGTITIADFITYISLNNDLFELVKDIIHMNLKSDYTDEEINDYIKVVNNYNKEAKINKLKIKLKQEVDPIKQAEILKEIMKIRGVRP
jgi:DNA primase